MENRAHALAAGLFMLFLGAAAAAALWWFGRPREEVDRYILETRGNVTGLNIQAPVRYRGIRAGRVEDITTNEKDPRIIEVLVTLDARYRLTQSTVAQLNTQGLTGLSYVQLEDDGSDPRPLATGNGELPRIVLAPSLLDQLGDQAGDIAVQLGQVALRVNRLLDDGNLRNLSRSLDNIAAASDGLKELPQVLAAVRQTFSDENLARLTTTLANLERTSAEAAPLVHEARDVVHSLAALSGRLDRFASRAGDEVTADTLPNINRLMQDMARSSQRLATLLESIERNPQVLVFGRGKIVPGPGEAGFVPPVDAERP